MFLTPGSRANRSRAWWSFVAGILKIFVGKQEALRVEPGGLVTFGGFANTAIAGSNAILQYVSNNLDWQLTGITIGNSNSTGGLAFAKTRATTPTVQTIVQSGDSVFDLFGYGSDGASYQNGARISMFVDGSPGAGSMPMRIVMSTSPAGFASPNEHLRIDGTGNVQVTGTTCSLGYAANTAGTGGTVTQGTSRTTGVTLNTICGAITLFAAAPTVGTWVTFTVTNSAVAATDTVIVSVKSATDTYVANVSAVAAGSFKISFMSISGTTSDSPVINFAVIKAVAS